MQTHLPVHATTAHAGGCSNVLVPAEVRQALTDTPHRELSMWEHAHSQGLRPPACDIGLSGCPLGSPQSTHSGQMAVTYLLRPASTTNCPWGLQKIVLACCLSNISEMKHSICDGSLQRLPSLLGAGGQPDISAPHL